MRRLGAKAARFDAIGSRILQRPLRQRVHGAARVAERAEDAIRALQDDGEIGARGARRLSRADAGQSEHEQQIAAAAGSR